MADTKADGTRGAAPRSPAAPAVPDAAPERSSDQAAPRGTGVFMPIVSRTHSNLRSKPGRRRNASASCLMPDAPDSARWQPRRNVSTASLAAAPAGQHQQHLGSQRATPGPADASFAPGLAGHTVLPSAGLSASAATVMVMAPCSHPASTAGVPYAGLINSQQQQQQQQRLQHQQVPLSPFALAPAPAGTHPYAASSAGLCQVTPAGGPLGSMQQQCSSSFLQPAGSLGGHVQAAQQLGADMKLQLLPFSGPQFDPVVGPGTAASVADSACFSAADMLPGTAGAGHLSSLLSSSSAVLLSGPQASGTLADPVLSQWASMGLSEQDLLTALTVEASGESSLEVQQDVIEQNISRLSLMKRILQLKQQHKSQQRLLQLQQQQQEQLLHQQLLEAGSSSAGMATQGTDAQQELLQLLQMQAPLTCSSSLPTNIAVTSAPAPQPTTLGLVLPAGTAGSPTTLLLQQQHAQHGRTLQAADAATLSGLLQQRLTLRQHEQAQQQAAQLSAPTNLLSQPMTATVQAAHGMSPSQGLMLQGWGQL